MVLARNNMDIEKLGKMNTEQLNEEFFTPLNPERVQFLANALCESVWDPDLKGYSSVLNKEHQGFVVDVLLRTYAFTTKELQQLIVDKIIEAIDGYWTNFTDFTNALAYNLDNEGSDLIVSQCIKRCRFCLDLLKSLKAKYVVNPGWTKLISKAIEENKFIDPSDVVGSTIIECRELLKEHT